MGIQYYGLFIGDCLDIRTLTSWQSIYLVVYLHNGASPLFIYNFGVQDVYHYNIHIHVSGVCLRISHLSTCILREVEADYPEEGTKAWNRADFPKLRNHVLGQLYYYPKHLTMVEVFVVKL